MPRELLINLTAYIYASAGWIPTCALLLLALASLHILSRGLQGYISINVSIKQLPYRILILATFHIQPSVNLTSSLRAGSRVNGCIISRIYQ